MKFSLKMKIRLGILITFLFIIAFVIHQDHAGVVLRNFQPKRMVEKSISTKPDTPPKIEPNGKNVDKFKKNSSVVYYHEANDTLVVLKANRSDEKDVNKKKLSPQISSGRNVLNSSKIHISDIKSKNQILKADHIQDSSGSIRPQSQKKQRSLEFEINTDNQTDISNLSDSMSTVFATKEFKNNPKSNSNDSIVGEKLKNETGADKENYLEPLNIEENSVNNASKIIADFNASHTQSTMDKSFNETEQKSVEVHRQIDQKLNFTASNVSNSPANSSKDFLLDEKSTNENEVNQKEDIILKQINDKENKDSDVSHTAPRIQKPLNNTKLPKQGGLNDTDLSRREPSIHKPLNDTKMHKQSDIKDSDVNLTMPSMHKPLNSTEIQKQSGQKDSDVNRTTYEPLNKTKVQKQSDDITNFASKIDEPLNVNSVLETNDKEKEDSGVSHAAPSVQKTFKDTEVQNANFANEINGSRDSAMKTNETGLNETDVGLESIVSAGLDFLANSEVAKNAALAIEIFNLSDSSLTDHIVDDSDSAIELVRPSTEEEINSSAVNESSVEHEIKINKKCPAPGICVFWFMARNTCNSDDQCMDSKICCRIRCSKQCISV